MLRDIRPKHGHNQIRACIPRCAEKGREGYDHTQTQNRKHRFQMGQALWLLIPEFFETLIPRRSMMALQVRERRGTFEDDRSAKNQVQNCGKYETQNKVESQQADRK